MKRFRLALALTFALPGLLIAQQGLSGRWEGLTPNRESVVLELAVKGADVGGTMTVGEEKAPIENGKVSKNRFTFSAAMGGGAEAFTGELAGDEIKIWMDDRGPGAAITLKRAAAPPRK
jgi:hypothetical protein